MTTPTSDNGQLTIGYRHIRAVAGLIGMALAIASAIAIQVAREAHTGALLAKGCPVKELALPTTWLQFTYSLAIPVGMPVLLFVLSIMLFSPTLMGQFITAIRGLLPGSRGAPTP